MFAEELIKEIEPRTLIYDRKDPLYRNKMEKARAWTQVANNLKSSVFDCQTRWKSLRDRYVRETHKMNLLSNSFPDEEIPLWKHYVMLDFLKGSIEPRKTLNFTKKREPLDPEDEFTQDFTMDNSDVKELIECEGLNEYNNDHDNDDSTAVSFSHVPISSNSPPASRKRKRSSRPEKKFSEIMFETVNTRVNEDSDDEGFLKMVGTLIKKAAKSERDSLRVETINYVYETVRQSMMKKTDAEVLNDNGANFVKL